MLSSQFDLYFDTGGDLFRGLDGQFFTFTRSPLHHRKGALSKLQVSLRRGTYNKWRSFIDRTEARLAPDSVKLYGAVEYGTVQMYSIL